MEHGVVALVAERAQDLPLDRCGVREQAQSLVGVRGEYQLQTDLRTFESIYEGASPQVVVELYAKLIHTADGQVVAARVFRETEPAAGVEVGPVVDAFSRALDRVTGQVTGWTLAEGNRQERSSAAGH